MTKTACCFRPAPEHAYFSSVIVVPRGPGPGRATVPVRVLLAEAKPQRLTLGAGFSSNTGYRTEMGYHDANLFQSTVVSGFGFAAPSKKQSLLFADVFLPPAGGAINQLRRALRARCDLEGLRLSPEAVGATRSHQRGKINSSVALKVRVSAPIRTDPTKVVGMPSPSTGLDQTRCQTSSIRGASC